MKMLQKIVYISFLLLISNLSVFSQSRQADSLKVKQIEYQKYLKEKAQKDKENAAIQNKKAAETVVVTYDSKGNKIETSKKNGETITVKTIKVSPPILNRPINPDTINVDSVYIKVFKSKNRMQVYYKGKAITAYKCVFGPNCTGQKMCEGDRKTPEGQFTILDVKKHDKWDTFMLLDFPNEESKKMFEEAKAKGIVPNNARIGGAIGIHGIWQNGDNVIDLKHNWTDGCVSIKNSDIQQLSKLVKPGYTQIAIFK